MLSQLNSFLDPLCLRWKELVPFSSNPRPFSRQKKTILTFLLYRNFYSVDAACKSLDNWPIAVPQNPLETVLSLRQHVT